MAQTTRVIIVDPSGSKKTTAEVPNNVAAQKLIKALARRMGLPEKIGQNGHPIRYRLTYTRAHEEIELDPEQTLELAGFRDDDEVRLYPDMQYDGGPLVRGIYYERSSHLFPLARLKKHYKKTPIRVYIIDPSGSKKTTAEVPNNVPTQKLLQALVKRLGLPEIGQNEILHYRWTFAKDGQEFELSPDWTLGEHGIEDDDVLRLYAVFSSGSHDPIWIKHGTEKYESTLTEDSLPQIVTAALEKQFFALELSKQEKALPLLLVRRLLEELKHVEALVVLKLSGNELSELPDEIVHLSHVTLLDLSDNRLERLPENFEKLLSLTRLDLHANKLQALPRKIGLLRNLVELDLSDNPIRELPKEIGRLKNLQRLKLNYTNLTTLPKEIGRLGLLQELSLFQADMIELPVELVRLERLETFKLSSSGLTFPPLEIAEQGKEAIFAYLKNYYTPAQRRSQDVLYEAKLLIVGQGGVGKTCLMKRLTRNIFLEGQTTTEGIEIAHWELDAPADHVEKMLLHVWDFGGQEIYHATHQFFLTQRSLYMLVWDSRQEEEFGRIDYWLNTIENLADDSPILIVMNKADERTKELNLRDIQERFPQVRGFWKVSAKSGANMNELRQVIQETAWKLPLMGTSWPSSWVAVRTALEDHAGFHMPYHEYLKLCRKHGIDQPEAQTLSRYLHDLGIILHFHNDVVLKDTIILKPEWGTDAVYSVLDADIVEHRDGNLRIEDLPNIWTDTASYPPDKYAALLRLMSNFELAFPIEHKEQYIVAELLPLREPPFTWQPKEPLRFEYHYEFLPAGVLTRFIVRMHEFLIETDGHKMCWREGAYLAYEDCQALVTIHPARRRVIIQIDGTLKREFLAIIRFHFAAIHKTLRKIRYTEQVPCICTPECGFRFDYNFLLKCEAKGKFQQTCGHSIDDIDIRILLDGFERAEHRGQGVPTNILGKVVDMLEEQPPIALNVHDFEEPVLPHHLHQEIVTFLTSLPNIHNEQALQALLFRAGLDPQLQNHLPAPAPPGQFFDMLIPTLIHYGELRDGRQPVVAVLESAKSLIGPKKAARCDVLIQKLLPHLQQDDGAEIVITSEEERVEPL